MTTTDTFPALLRGKYELTKPLKGGPVFAFPAIGISIVDFSKLTERQAERLLAKKWPGIRRVEKQTGKRPVAVPDDTGIQQ